MKRDPVILIVVAVVISLMLVFGIQKTRHSSFQPGGAGKIAGSTGSRFFFGLG